MAAKVKAIKAKMNAKAGATKALGAVTSLFKRGGDGESEDSSDLDSDDTTEEVPSEDEVRRSPSHACLLVW